MRFKYGDKIIIREGFKLHSFKLHNFKGSYSEVYTVLSCYYDNTHGVEFVEFYAGGTKYTYPSQAFDLVEE